jgi:serine/threonine protein kinase
VPWSSPEVVTEATTGTVPSEVWSLGATLYTLLAGRSPFAEPQRERNTRELMRARVAKAGYTPIGRGDVPRPVEELLARTMSLDPARRPQSMHALGEELRELQAELGLMRTPLEVIAEQYATVVRTSSFSEAAAGAARGPVVATVQADSRRLARSRRKAPSRPVAAEEIEPGGGRSGAWRWGLIGAAIGLVAAGVVVLVLVVSGVLG